MLLLSTQASDMLDSLLLNVNGGSGNPGVLRIYSGSPPANPDGTATGSLLAECLAVDPSMPAFGAASGTTVISATGVTSGGYFAVTSSAIGTGTAGYWRLSDYAGLLIGQGSVSVVGGGGELQLSTLSIVSGLPVNITSFVVSLTGLTY